MKKIFAALAICGLLFAANTNVQAAGNDSPTGWGVGIEAGQELGAVPYYTLSSMFQLGLAVGMKLQSNNNIFLLAPQARFMFPIGLAAAKLFLDAQLRFAFQNNNYIALRTRLGLMTMVTAAMCMYGGVSFLDFQFDPQEITCIGLLAPFIGIEWSFN